MDNFTPPPPPPSPLDNSYWQWATEQDQNFNGYYSEPPYAQPSTEQASTEQPPTKQVPTEQAKPFDWNQFISSKKPQTVDLIEVPYIEPVSLNQQLKPLDPNLVVEYMRLDEAGDAQLLGALYKDRICYDRLTKKWYFWKGHHWGEDELGSILLILPGHLASQYIMAAGAIQQQVKVEPGKNKFAHLVPPNAKELEVALRDLIDQLHKAAKRLRFMSRCKNVLGYAKPVFAISGKEWDSNPWLLGVKNGVLQLKRGEIGFRNGQPSDYIRTVAPTEWKGLECGVPRFETFLSEILEGATDVQATTHYVQNLLGYAILGKAHENMFAILYGDRGQNGKGTLYKILGEVLGEKLCGTVSEDVFLSKRRGTSGAASPHLVDLKGMRLAWCAETDEGDRLNAAQVKRLTGNEPLKARALHQKPIQWRPTHTLFLMTNNKPHISAEDNAIWIRVALIPFLMTFKNNPQGPYERQKDPFLFDKLTSEQGKSGVLALLVKWCIRYQEEGLNLPDCLQASKEAYRDEEDDIGHFIAECCFVSEDAEECLHKGRKSRTFVAAKNLYDAYKEWHAENSPGKPMSSTAFGKRMKKRLFSRKGREGKRRGTFYYGIKLINPD